MELIRQLLQRDPLSFWRQAGRICLRLLEARAARYAVLADPVGHLSGRKSSRTR